MLIDTNDFKVNEDRFGNLTLKFTKHTVFEKGDNIFVSTEFKDREKQFKQSLITQIKSLQEEPTRSGIINLIEKL
jgi:hypothetical protein